MSKLLSSIVILLLLTIGVQSRPPKCVPIPAQQCRSLGYNQTRFPNLAAGDSEETAVDEFNTFGPLISVGCSEYLTFFLCASYFPLCNEKVAQPIGPCQPLCIKVRDACIGVLQEFSYSWPDQLDCSRFPVENNEDHMCMEGSKQFARTSATKNENAMSEYRPKNQKPRIQKPSTVLNGRCSSSAYVYMNRTGRCVPRCGEDIHFSQTDTYSTRSALILGSILSFVLTVACLMCSCFGRTLVKDKKAMDNTLFYCAFCFAFSAAIYLLSVFQKEKFACFTYQTHELFVVPGIPHVPCTLVATLLYYSGMSARLWWLCACAAWRMSMKESGTKKVYDFMYKAHVLCWASPFALVTIALMAQAAQADPLSGMCFIGASNVNYQMFILLRDVVITLVSIFVLFSGCWSNKRSTSAEISSSNGLGILCAIFPMAQIFWLVAAATHIYFHNASDPVLSVGSMAKQLTDLAMGAILGGALLVYLLHTCWWDSGVVGAPTKNGYQPAHPLYPPQPQHGTIQTNINPGNLTSTTSCPMTSSSQRSSANIQPQPTYGTTFVPPQQPPPPPPPIASLRQLANC